MALDNALSPAWGNPADEVAVARIPAGTTIYWGSAAPQALGNGGSLLGGGSQVYLRAFDPEWITETWSLP